MVIRDAIAADAAAIADIWNAIIRTSPITYTSIEKTEAEIETLIQDRPFLSAIEGDDLIGFATYGPFRSGPGYRFVAEHSVYVKDGAQAKGVGHALMDQLEEIALGNGIDVMMAGMDSENHIARRFHAKRGFQQVGYMPGIAEKFGARHDFVLMQKNLITP